MTGSKTSGIKWWGYLIIGIVIFISCFVLVDFVEFLTAKSQTYGTYNYVPAEQGDTIFSEEIFEVMTTQDGVNYTITKSFDSIEFNGNENEYIMKVNDLPLYDQTTTPGSITGTFNLTYRGTSGDVVGESTATILVNFYESQTDLVISIADQNGSVTHFDNYISANGLNIKILEVA